MLDLTHGTTSAKSHPMGSLIRSVVLLVLVASCAGGEGEEGDGEYSCTDGEMITHACASADGSICESSTCVAGLWECPEGLYETPGCFGPQPSRDCSDLGGGQAILGERCLDDVVEYCIYSDTSQTATWTEIMTCTAPDLCQELNDEACCQSENGICLD